MVQMFDSNGQAKEPTAVDLNGGGELDLSSAGSLSKIKATVQVEGTATLPAELRIGLRDGKGRTSFTMVDTKGEANFPVWLLADMSLTRDLRRNGIRWCALCRTRERFLEIR